MSERRRGFEIYYIQILGVHSSVVL